MIGNVGLHEPIAMNNRPHAKGFAIWICIVLFAVYFASDVPVGYVFWRLDYGAFPVALAAFYAPVDYIAAHCVPVDRFFHWQFDALVAVCDCLHV